jgi:hypothetical protein
MTTLAGSSGLSRHASEAGALRAIAKRRQVLPVAADVMKLPRVGTPRSPTLGAYAGAMWQ